jgi:thiol-disulfide isomerase/thioredoxin
LVCALGAAALIGCDRGGTQEQSAKPQAATDESAAPQAKAIGLLQVGDSAALEKILAAHRGNVVLVDFWATWCGPCVEEFPHTVDLWRKYSQRGLAVVSVSMDSPKSEPQVRAFLEKQEARFDNLLSSYDSPLEATKAFGLPGPVPCYRVYGRDGELKREFSVDPKAARQFTAADIEAAVVENL